MYFHSALSPSPVHAAFTGIQLDPLGKLNLTNSQSNLLKAAEDKVVEYTVAVQEDASAYVHLLFIILDQVIDSSTSSKSGVSKLKLEDVLSDEDALHMMHDDYKGVIAHYAITKLYEVILCLKDAHSNASVTMASTFYGSGSLVEEWRPLLRILHLRGGSGDAFAQRGAALCLAYILLEGCPSRMKKIKGAKKSIDQDLVPVMEPLRALVSWIASRLQSSSVTSLSIVTPSLCVLVAAQEARVIFDETGGIGYLSRHLRVRQTSSTSNSQPSGVSVQQLYELCFCLWIMTYDCNKSPTIRNHFHRDGAVAALVDLISAAPREKVVRVALSALRNLATCTDDGDIDIFEESSSNLMDSQSRRKVEGSTFLSDMIGCGLIKSIDLMKDRQWTDPDIVEDLDALHALLHENFKEMTRWDVYNAEVESGHLQWGIVHTEKFFKENAKKMEGSDGNFFILKRLIALTSSHDDEVVSIACFDVGEFVRHYPNGRAIVKRLGAKDVVMNLIDHENPEVQRHALQCMSKMLVQNWQAVN